MADTIQRQRNVPLWLGTVLILLTVVSTVPQFYGLKFAPGILPWLGLLLPAAAVFCFVVGVSRAFKQPQIYRGKTLGSILSFLAIMFFAGSVWLYTHARDLPKSASAPKVGQKAPDFTLKDTTGQPVTLAQMLSIPIDSASGKAPKAVLLIFYRGYW
jgi:hypothetical protein